MINCNYGLSNTGTGCMALLRALKGIILVPTWTNGGDLNTIDTTDTLDKAYFDAWVNNADYSARMYPLPSMKNVSNDRAESLKEGFEDGTQVIIQQAVRKFSGIIVDKDASPVLQGKLLSFRNMDVSFYGIDKDENLIGVRDQTTTTNLNPIRLDANTFDAIFNGGTDKATQKLMVSFDVHQDEVDSELQAITLAERGGFKMASLRGLLDVSATFTSPLHAGTFTVQLNTEYGSIINPLTVKGMVKADFALYNVTDSASITITSVTEQTDANGRPTGVYDFVFPSQTASDVVKLTPTYTGYDFAKVIAARVTLV